MRGGGKLPKAKGINSANLLNSLSAVWSTLLANPSFMLAAVITDDEYDDDQAERYSYGSTSLAARRVDGKKGGSTVPGRPRLLIMMLVI